MTVPLRRTAAVAAAALVTLSGLTACTPEIGAAIGVSADESDLAGLEPGSVLVIDYQDDAEPSRELTLDEFTRRGAEQC